MTPGLENQIGDQTAYDRNVEKLREAGVVLSRIAELADPASHLSEKA